LNLSLENEQATTTLDKVQGSGRLALIGRAKEIAARATVMRDSMLTEDQALPYSRDMGLKGIITAGIGPLHHYVRR